MVVFSDQVSFDKMFTTRKAEFSAFISILGPAAINSDPPAMERMKKTDVVMHLMGDHTAYRKKVFKYAFEVLCKNMGKKIPTQLSLSRKLLTDFAVKSYRAEAESLSAIYEPRAITGINSAAENRKLHNALQRYGYSLGLSKRQADKDEGQRWRRKAFELIYRNHKNRKKQRISELENPLAETEWYQSFEFLIYAGMDLFGHGNAQEREVLAKTVLEIVHECSKKAMSHRQDYLSFHRAEALVELGKIAFERRRFDVALSYNYKALEIHKTLAKVYGEHVAVKNMQDLAAALGNMGRHEEAVDIFKEVVRISEIHLGMGHEKMAVHYKNYGLAVMHAFTDKQNKVLGKQLLERAIEVWDLTGSPEIVDNRDYQLAQHFLLS